MARRRRRGSRTRHIEFLEPRLALTGFTAYNGLFPSGDTHEHTTFYADLSDHDASGPLIDVESGHETGVLLTASQVGVNFGGNGSNPAPGTDAHEIFDGFVDLAAGSQRSLEIQPGDAYQYTFENLDPGATYDFAGTAIRGNSGYTDRWTLVEIQGAASSSRMHSVGASVVVDGLPLNQVAIWTGNNASADQGVVAQWLDIDPGADGVFHVVSTQYRGSVPREIDGDGIADGSKGYGLAAIRLTENVPEGPPAVENIAAEDVMAFQATVGGRISTTGGQVPQVTVYYGTTDGGMNAAAWQHSVQLGGMSRDFSATLDGLSPGNAYYFRSFAENTLGSAWATTSEIFTTLPANAPIVENLPATNVGAFAAVLTGQVVDTGNDPPIVTLYYGESDGGTNAGSWEHVMDLGVQQGAFNASVLALQPLTQYYFTSYAQNAVGDDWATSSIRFATTDTPPLQINEWMSDNATTLTTRIREAVGQPFRGDDLTPDWIELHNPTAEVADLGGYYLSDDLADLRAWQFPAGTLIPAGGYLVVFASGLDLHDPRLDERGYLHTNFQLGGESGDDLALIDAEGTIVFCARELSASKRGCFLWHRPVRQRTLLWRSHAGREQRTRSPSAPQITVDSATFHGSFVVELIPAMSTHTVHYTLNEQVPTPASPVYDGPLTISTTTQLRAISVAPNGKSSVVVSETYVQLATDLQDRSSNLPVLIVEAFGDGVPRSNFGDVFVALIEPGEDGRSRLVDEFDLMTRAGIHVRGSSSAGFSKKQYRVEFWDEQNEDQKWEVLGMPREADWIFYGPGPYDRALISNPLMFDLSNQIGRYATRTRWVEMYLNSNGGSLTAADYVGVYAIGEVVEQGDDRVDVERLTTGAGGLPVEGGFVWKNDRGSAYVDPEDPTSAQRSYINGWISGLSSSAAGPSSHDPERGYAKYADVDSFIDHNILNLLAMNVDALRLSSFYHQSADGKLQAGPIWDFDRSLDSTDGRDNNPRTWYGTGDSTRYFNDSDRVMSWWPDMFQDPDFVQRYIDRWTELRKNEFSLENLNATIDRHAAQLAEAAPRDYQRWSSARYGNFAGEIQHLKTWLRQRVEWIDSQWLVTPTFDVATPQVPVGTAVSLRAPQGQIYYTLDGSDPRGQNGTIRPEAHLATGPIAIHGFTRIVARVYRQSHGPTTQGYIPNGDDWSAPVEGIYFNDPPAASGNLAFSEIQYNPHPPSAKEEAAGFDDDDDFEFLEIVNTSQTNVVLTGAQLALVEHDDENEGVAFDFTNSSMTTLAPGERILVVEDLSAFRFRYGDGLPVAGQWQGGLSDSGEMLTLLAYDGAVIQQFTYNDKADWPIRADGDGSSLELVDPQEQPQDPRNWRASVEFGGSPGREGLEPIGVVINEILAHTDPPMTPSDSIELLNLTAAAVDLSGWYLSDSTQQLRKFQIPDGTILPSGAYLVFDEGDFRPDPENPGPDDFALSSSRGDEVWLVIPDENGGVQQFVDEVRFPATPNGESMGRWPNGTGELAPMSQRTLGNDNATPRVGPIVINELHYHPGAPSDEALAMDASITANHLEFVEIVNPTARAVDLTEWRIRGGIDYDFDPGTLLPSGGRLVVISFNPAKPENINRMAAFRVHYGMDDSVPLVGGYSGRLSDEGETVRLQRPDEPPAEDPLFIPRLLEDQVSYATTSPWPDADGTGLSLVRVSPFAFGCFASSWQPVTPSPGRHDLDGDLNGDGQLNAQDIDLVSDGIRRQDPAFDLTGDGVLDSLDLDWFVRSVLHTTPGDANVDGQFDSTDMVQVFQEGEYEDESVENSGWSEGDWNGDGDFDSSDMVIAFQDGSYEISNAAPGAEIGPVTALSTVDPVRQRPSSLGTFYALVASSAHWLHGDSKIKKRAQLPTRRRSSLSTDAPLQETCAAGSVSFEVDLDRRIREQIFAQSRWADGPSQKPLEETWNAESVDLTWTGGDQSRSARVSDR